MVILFSGTVGVFADPEDFAYVEGPEIVNTTDSSNFPVYSPEDVYGAVDTSGATEITSMFSDEAFDIFADEIDRLALFEPVGDSDVSGVLGKVESFVSSGGVGAAEAYSIRATSSIRETAASTGYS